MFFSTLLVSEQTTSAVKWISVLGVVLVLGLIAFVGFSKNKKFDAKKLAFAGVCASLSFTLAVIKFSPYSGSITLASFVPILIYAYAFGVTDGLLIGLVHGLLNFIEDPYILTPATFLFDYLLAFASVGVMGFFGKMNRKERSSLPIVLGCVCVFSLRFLFHFLSGLIFFAQGAIWVEFPAWAMNNAFAYSFLYNCLYIPFDALIASVALVILCKSGVLDRLVKLMKNQ